MGRWVIALLAAGVTLVATSAHAQTEQVVRARTVFAAHQLSSNAITTFTVACPRGYIAVSAGVSTPGRGTTLLEITPLGLSSYRFRFGNPVTNDDQRVTVVVACRSVGGTRNVLRLQPLKTRYVTAPPRKAAAATLACPSHTTPVAAGVDLDPGRRKSVYSFRGAPALSIRRQISTLSGLSFSVANGGTQPRTVAFYGGCLTLVRAAGTAPERLHVSLTTISLALQPGPQTLTRSCPRGWVSLSAGYALLSKSATTAGATAIGRRGRWSVNNDSAADTEADLQLACGRLAP